MRLFALILLAFAVLPARGQIMDVPSVPHMAAEDEYHLAEIIRSDTLVYARWEGFDDRVEAVFDDEYADPLWWHSANWFSFPGVWDPVPVPANCADVRDRVLCMAHVATLAIVEEYHTILRER